MYFSKIPANNIRAIIPFAPPIINPRTILRFLYAEMLPSNKNNSKLVSNRNATTDIKKIITIEKNIMMVVFIERYCDIKKDRST